MAALAKDALARVFLNGIVAGQVDAVFRDKVVEDPAAQAACQPPGGPTAFGEDVVITGGMARGQDAKRAQKVADSAAAEGKDGCQGEDDKAEKGRASETARQGVEQGAGRLWHGLVDTLELAACEAGLVRLPPAAFAVEPTRAAALATA